MSASADRRSAPLLGMTLGEPAGIGPEIALKAWLAREAQPTPTFVVYGDTDLLANRAQRFGLAVPIEPVSRAERGREVFARALPVMSLPLAAPSEPGSPDVANAAATIAAISRAVEDACAGRIDGVVTNPIAKGVLYEAGFAHPGHTEYLAELARRFLPGCDAFPVMMLASDTLRVVPLTIHVPLSRVPALITGELIQRTVRVVAAALRRDLAVRQPRIAIAGLNPHAGEGGAIGREDADIIRPAIEALQRDGFDVTGPHSADTLFHAAARASYDAAIAMYHDQALIPIKTLAFDTGVNVTLGLPFLRTSPDHGTAFDIAARGGASATSLIAAVRMAGEIAANRHRAAT